MRFLSVLLLAAAVGCRSSVFRADIDPWLRGDARAAYAALVAQGEAGVADEDLALWQCELGSAALCAGDEETAFSAFDAASATMGTLESTTAENARAILGAEATKTWRGDPHERAMNALYKGLLYWRRGDLGNASACFRRGLLADGYSEAGEHQQDFAALAFLLGWASRLRGRPEQADFSFREAAGILPRNPYFADPRPDERNVLIVAEIGAGPVKFASGTGGSIARFSDPPHPEAAIEVSVDGGRFARSALATDLYHQAVTRGEKVIDGIRKGKAVFREGTFIAGAIVLDEGLRRGKDEMILVGGGLLVLSLLTNPRADTRHWSLLPGEIHVLPLSVPPGPRRLTVRAVDAGGAPLPGWERSLDVVVPTGEDTLYYIRTGPGGRIYALTGPENGTPLAEE